MSNDRAQELDDLVGRVLASMNAGRDKPIPASEHSFVAEICTEVLDRIDEVCADKSDAAKRPGGYETYGIEIHLSCYGPASSGPYRSDAAPELGDITAEAGRAATRVLKNAGLHMWGSGVYRASGSLGKTWVGSVPNE